MDESAFTPDDVPLASGDDRARLRAVLAFPDPIDAAPVRSRAAAPEPLEDLDGGRSLSMPPADVLGRLVTHQIDLDARLAELERKVDKLVEIASVDRDGDSLRQSVDHLSHDVGALHAFVSGWREASTRILRRTVRSELERAGAVVADEHPRPVEPRPARRRRT